MSYNKSTIDVSVIIPAYNAEKFIQETIKSVVTQNAPDFIFEVLLIDDGSTDNTLKLAQDMSKKYKELFVFTQENSGSPSRPRNFGIDNARGKYVLFLDADDILCENALYSMYTEAKKTRNQMILGKFIGRNGRKVPSQIFTKTTHNADLLEDMAWHNLSPTAKLCDLEVIKSNNIRFFEDQWIGEDQNFFAKLYFKVQGISILSEQNYVEVGLNDDGSNLTTRKQTLNDKAKTAVRLGNVIKENTVPSIVRDRLSQRIFTLTLPSVINQFYDKESAYQREKFVCAMYQQLSDLYKPKHADSLPLNVRIGFTLMFAGLVDDLDLLLCSGKKFDPVYVIKDDKLELELPPLSEKALSLIDTTFTHKGHIKSKLLSIEKDFDGNLNISFEIEISKVRDIPENIEIILRERSTGEEIIVLPLFDSIFNSNTNSWVIRLYWTLNNSFSIPKGAWGTFYRLSWGKTFIEDRWGKRSQHLKNEKFAIQIQTNNLVAYFNKGYENLTLDVGYTVHNQSLVESLL